VLQECACGEPLVDNSSRCSQCGAANPGFRPSRWRVFWPEVDTPAGSDEAIRLGYWAAFSVAVLGTVMTVLARGVSLAGLVDAAFFALCGLGIWWKWRIPALLAFLVYLANVVLSISQGGGVGVLAVFIFVGLLNGLRGTFQRARLPREMLSRPQ